MARLWLSLCVAVVGLIGSRAKPVAEEDHGGSNTHGGGLKTHNVDLRMPNVQPLVADTYFCHAMKMDSDPSYLVGFIPHGNMSTAHHILLYGCQEPGHTKGVWNCGEMTSKTAGYGDGPVCKEGANIVYAWAMDAPELHLPKDVGFKVGGKTDIPWLVLQVHYKDVSKFVPPANGKDNSGLTLITTKKHQPKRAGVYLLATNGEIPAHSTTYMETACSISEPVTLHPFAYRVHAHTHGEVVSGYRVRDGQWEEIGRQTPKKPQMFYNVSHPGMDVEEGDVLAARCTMVNGENRTVAVGNTQKDEMCNFYIMYWVDGDKILADTYCVSPGPPDWYWDDLDGIERGDFPTNASVVPGTDKLLDASEHLLSKAEGLFKEAGQPFNSDLLRLLEDVQSELGADVARVEDYPEYYGEGEEREGMRDRVPDLQGYPGYGEDWQEEVPRRGEMNLDSYPLYGNKLKPPFYEDRIQQY